MTKQEKKTVTISGLIAAALVALAVVSTAILSKQAAGCLEGAKSQAESVACERAVAGE